MKEEIGKYMYGNVKHENSISRQIFVVKKLDKIYHTQGYVEKCKCTDAESHHCNMLSNSEY